MLLLKDPTDWFRDLQLILDVVMSGASFSFTWAQMSLGSFYGRDESLCNVPADEETERLMLELQNP